MRNLVKVFSTIAALTATVPMLLFAASPTNDAFDAPIVLSVVPATATGTNIDATLEPGEPLPNTWVDYAEASVWFRWTSPTTGPVQMDTLGSDFDTMLAVWNGDALSNLTLLAENDQYGGDQSAVFIAATSGVTYQIGVYGWSDARGVITLNITNDVTSKISGTVTAPNGTTLLQDIDATAYRCTGPDWTPVQDGVSDSNGVYTIAGLPAGTYRVQFEDWQNGDYLSEVYDDVTDLDSGSDIIVPADTIVPGIDASLANASKISGTVTALDGETPLQGVDAKAYRWTGSDWGDWVRSGYTDANGDYTIGGLPAGTYRVRFDDRDGNYASEVYDDATDLDSGTDIVVLAETTVTDIDASLAALAPPAPPVLVGMRQTGLSSFEILFIGTVGQDYILQEAISLTNSWGDVGGSFACQPGTNIAPRVQPAPAAFWRVRMVPQSANK